MPYQNDAEAIVNTQREIEDLINRPPGWLLRSGIMTIAIVVLLILRLSALIEYPEKIIAKGVLTSSNPPKIVFSHIDGIVDSIYYTSGEKIIEGSPILSFKKKIKEGNSSQDQLESDYLLKAPISGILKTRFTIDKGTKIRAGETIGLITMELEKDKKFSIAHIPYNSIEKVTIGDAAIIKIPTDGSTFEILNGVVSLKSEVGVQDQMTGMLQYELRIDLTEPIEMTVANPSNQESEIIAEIFTDRKSVLERILSEFLSLIN